MFVSEEASHFSLWFSEGLRYALIVKIAGVLWAPDQSCYFVFFFYSDRNFFFVHNISNMISYDWKQLLIIRSVIPNLNLDGGVYFK
jgi:hypothetical protein